MSMVQPPVPLSSPPAAGSAAWEPVDDAYRSLLAGHEGEDRWLLVQTLLTGAPRRALFGMLGVPHGGRMLDVGTGFGPLALELAGATGGTAIGVDVDIARLRQAVALRDTLRARGWIRPWAAPASAASGHEHTAPSGTPAGAPSTPPGTHATATAGDASFAASDATALPFADKTFDAATIRFVLQYFSDPEVTLAEMARVVRPGGVVCVIDVDDGLSIVHPEPPGPLARLRAAFSALQSERGGDRTVGRKVPGLLDQAGFTVTAVLVMPQAAYGPSSPTDIDRTFLFDRFSQAADDIVARGLLSEADVRAGLQVLSTEEIPPRTSIEGHLAVIGRRRPT
ncbi:MAG: methyltransferase domain-containing protein [Actinomycetota bacterium]|nr:methyltransferase domain-containing protein [Actinomycetota bacterium]